MFNRAEFYTDLKKSSGTFKGRLTTPQVAGIESLLNAAISHKVDNLHHVANMLAETHHETGGYMSPIKETVMPSSSNKNPSDATVITRLDNAWKKGQLPWVKEPYWRDGWFGRGQVQITHKDNYAKVGKAIGVDLVKTPDLALDPVISGEIVVVAMLEGLFTGKKLADFNFPTALNADVPHNPRRIINGKDGTDIEVAKTHRVFYNALVAGKYSVS